MDKESTAPAEASFPHLPISPATMTLKTITLITLIGCITAMLMSLGTYISIILHGHIYSNFWYHVATTIIRDGSLIFFLSHLYLRGTPKP